MYQIRLSRTYRKHIKKLDTATQQLVRRIVERLANGDTLERKYCDHALKGEFIGYRECHIKPNLLLVYQKQDDNLVLYCLNISSHSEIF